MTEDLKGRTIRQMDIQKDKFRHWMRLKPFNTIRNTI